MLTFPAPHNLHGDALTAELAAAGFPAATVYVRGDELVISSVQDGDKKAVAAVVGAHVPPPPSAPSASLADRLAAVEARLDKAASAAVTGDAAKLRDGLKPVT